MPRLNQPAAERPCRRASSRPSPRSAAARRASCVMVVAVRGMAVIVCAWSCVTVIVVAMIVMAMSMAAGGRNVLEPALLQAAGDEERRGDRRNSR